MGVYYRLSFSPLPSSFLHARLRTATLRHDEAGQAQLINLLLRNYLHYNLYDQVQPLALHHLPLRIYGKPESRGMGIAGIVHSAQTV